MKVIITGGTGMIGTALSRRLVQDGDEVVVLSRSGRKPPELPQPVRVVQWDAETGHGWSHELDGADAVVNFAGENLAAGRWTQRRKDRIRASRLNAAQAVIDAVEQSGHVPSRVLQASGISYYGDRWDKYITEDEPPGDDFLARLCVEWEQSTAPLERAGASRAILRTGVTLTLRGGALPRMAMPFRLFVGGAIGPGTQGISWIHMLDHVEATRFLLDEPSVTGPVNVTAPNPVTNREFSDAVGRAMGRPGPFRAPSFAVRLAFGEMADTVLKGQFAVPQRLLDAGYRFRFPFIEDAMQDIMHADDELHLESPRSAA